MTMPGFDPEEVQVTATPSEILVELKPEKAEEMKVLWTEFGPNNIYRQFEMPEPTDVEKTRAMLYITAAKAPAAKVTPITVAAA